MSYASDFVLTLFTNDAVLAAAADDAGVERIGIDMEKVGKSARQGHLATWISDHDEADLAAIRPVLRRARLFTRCNPVHAGSRDEIDRLIAAGVQVIMLPYFRTTADAERFIRLVDGRAHPVLLVETADAAAVIADLCRIAGVAEIHIGLNDMRLSLRWPSHFHVLVSEFLAGLCDTVLDAGLRLGVGGLGRAGDNDLPMPSDLVSAQVVRLRAGAALVSRSIFRAPAPADLPAAFAQLRAWLDHCARQTGAWHSEQREQLRERLALQYGDLDALDLADAAMLAALPVP
jgi:hypothetical protein